MKLLVDRCAGPSLANSLRAQGHDVLESRSSDPILAIRHCSNERLPNPGSWLLSTLISENSYTSGVSCMLA